MKLPELPEPALKIYHDDAAFNEIAPPTPYYTCGQMLEYASAVLAALTGEPNDGR